MVDFEFSPFNDLLLATAAEDATVKLWVLPQDGVKEDINESDAELRGHGKKLQLIKFHPSAEHCLASTAADNSVRIWDLSKQKCMGVYDSLKHVGTGLDWCPNGSLLGCISKDKTIHLFDPRKEG